jgi:hypothetical protein
MTTVTYLGLHAMTALVGKKLSSQEELARLKGLLENRIVGGRVAFVLFKARRNNMLQSQQR